MKNIVEILKNIKSKNIPELQAAIELEIKTLKNIEKDLENIGIVRFVKERNFDKIAKVQDKLLFLDERIKELEEIISEIKEEKTKVEEIEEVKQDEEKEEIKEVEEVTVEESKEEIVPEKSIDPNAHFLIENLKKETPDHFIIQGKMYMVDSWRNLLEKTCDYLSYIDNKKLEKILLSNKLPIKYGEAYGSKPQEIFFEYYLSMLNRYIEVPSLYTTVSSIIKKLLSDYDIPIDEFQIFFKEKFKDMIIGNLKIKDVDDGKERYLLEEAYDDNFEIFQNRKPYAFMIKTHKVKVNSWIEILIETCYYFSQREKQIIKHILETEKIRGEEKIYLSSRSGALDKPESLIDMSGFVETNLTEFEIMDAIKQLLLTFQILEKEFVIILADKDI